VDQRNSHPEADHSLLDTLPLRDQDRKWGFFDFLCVQSGLAIATWAFLFGGVTANFVDFWDGLWTMLFGNCIGVALMLLASALPTSKWGAEHFVMQRSIYGTLGVMVLVLGVMTLSMIGWTTILAVMFGKAVTEVLASASVPLDGPGASALEPGIALFALLAGWFIVAHGDAALRALNRLAAPALVAMSGALLAAIFSQKSLAEIVAAAPLAPLDDHATNIMLAVELNIAAGMSWSSLAGNISRAARTPRIALWGGFIGYAPVAVLAQMVGLTAALLMGSSDPTAWMLPIVGPLGGAVLLVLIGFANLTSLSGVGYAVLQTFTQHLGPRVQRFGWKRTAAVFFLLCAACISLTATALYDQFFVFVAWVQAALASAIGVTLADYYVLRRRAVDLAQLYEVEASGRYFYWSRVNYAALSALLAGAVVYVLILNPSTLDSAPVFGLATASLPATAASFLIHIALTRLAVIPAGKGGYQRAWRETAIAASTPHA
jgi:NCS1 family nucleobase:cation symporter-1